MKVTHYIKWFSNISPFIKLNIDGAFSKASMHRGAGDMFRDHTGNWLIGFSQGFYCSSSNQSEFMTLKKGLELAITVGIQYLKINSDPKVLIQSLIKNNAPTNLVSILYDCRWLLMKL